MKKIKYFSAITLLLLFLFGLFFLWASSPTLLKEDYKKTIVNHFKSSYNQDSIYSIVTYNIGYLSGMTNNRAIEKPLSLFKNNLKKVRTEFKKENPDIIAFQEIDYNATRSYQVHQQNEIATLGYNYVAESVNWDETYVPYPYWPPTMHFGKIVSGQSILSKYPIKNHQRIVLERVSSDPFYRDAMYLDRLAQVVNILIEGKEVVVINVHLEAFDTETRIKQFHKVLALFNQYKKTNPTILLGDFNSEARNKKAIVHEIFSMDDVGNAAFDLKNPSNTYDTKKPYQRIDYIFYTKNSIDYVGGKVLTNFEEASDHLPIKMSFRLK